MLFDNAHDFFVYTDDAGEKYYYDNNTGEATYVFPHDGFVFDPETRKRLYIPPGDWEEEELAEAGTLITNIDYGFPMPTLRSPDEPVAPVSLNSPRLSVIDVAPRIVIQPPVQPKLLQKMSPEMIRPQMLAGIEQFQTPEFAKKFFKEHRTGGLFHKKIVPIDDMVKFTSKAIKAPLLASLPKTLEKQAVRCFKDILVYSCVTKARKSDSYAENVVARLTEHPQLVDEVYFQLMKQTTDNPNPKWLAKTWSLFLIVATIFPSLRDTENWIFAHLEREMKNEANDQIVKDLAQFSYIRFEARCSLGKVMKIPGLRYIHQIPDHPELIKTQMCTSIYELMWMQRKTMPLLPIPYVLHLMAERVFELDAINTEGIFRITGNCRLIDELSLNVNDSVDCVKTAGIHEVCSLMKMWMRELPNTIVPISLADSLQVHVENNTMMEFLEEIPTTHKYVLMYLVGFLKKLVQHQSVTKMGIQNMGTVFGPNIIRTRDTALERVKAAARAGCDFLVFLMTHWDTSEIYPLDPELLK